jgi:hypothetical protein
VRCRAAGAVVQTKQRHTVTISRVERHKVENDPIGKRSVQYAPS